MMNKSALKFAFIMALIVTSYISFILVSVNAGFNNNFIFIWLRSWFIAFLLAFPSLLFVAPLVRKKLKL
ncbi:Transmembrane protein of unknown function [Flavobacterium indicum GPTSA100-9 = DSM 17447]|uniref:DUF2798 domain-containing protein n=1 Tax=Flavobacterium indicum (strain DSM 17447 / CIP 109464 / GPTSA100-9) TaxID=1094466 RepID=H8XTM5_FLAIG|nr:Transmembrane protein of unknown function [Flavobacterium indicum GPTSA100-9 = DSM 17447]